MAHIRDPFLHEFENMSRNRSFPKAMLACSASRSLCSKWPGVVEQWEEPKTQSPKLPKLSSEATEEAPAEASEEAPAEQPAPPEAELTYAWQQTDAEVKVYVSFDQAEDLTDVTESQVQSEFGEWSASLLINVDRGAMLAAGGMEELPNQGVLEVVVLLLKLSQVRGSRPDLCLVLMSATMESEKLVRYFGSPSSVPVLSIPGRTFPAKTSDLELRV
eukprot:s386_g1.t1